MTGLSRTVTTAILGSVVSLGSSAAGLRADNANWPQWRGPDFNGMARSEAPQSWSETRNLKWKVEVPGRGHSTPVVWGDRIFATTAVPTGAPQTVTASEDQPERAGGPGVSQAPPGAAESAPQAEHRFEVLCLNRKTGAILWQRTATVAVPHEGYHRTYGSFASSPPVTDGESVFAFFGSRGLYRYDMNGTLVWKKDFAVRMKMRLGFGEGAAPVLHQDGLILTFDQEADSFIVAVDRNTGAERWRAARDEKSSWSTPLVLTHEGRTQVVVGGTNKVRSYDFRTGAVIWECAGLGTNVIPALVSQGDLVYAMSGHREPKLLAIRLGGEGDVTASRVVWSETRGLSYTASPVLHDNKLYVLTDTGLLSCFDATTGKPYYRQVRLSKPATFKASPIGAGGKLYLASEEGDVFVVKMGAAFEVLATNTFQDEFFIASPVIVDGEIFLRGRNHLYAITGKS